jgi:fumarylacetoacetate (FAA) hydrolase
MRLVNFVPPDTAALPRLGAVVNDIVVDIASTQPGINLITELMEVGSELRAEMESALLGQAVAGAVGFAHPTTRLLQSWRLDEVRLLPPLRRPTSLRDFYAFEQHVATANRNRGRDVPPEWYEFPVFYFSNANAVYGPDATIPYPSFTTELDYELEVACIIGRAGRDIPANEAEQYIFGYTIFNDWSARDVQRRETKVGLGPAKAKDFASSFGPMIVTPDELVDRATGRPGVYDLEMVARVNGVERSRGNWKDIHYSFGEMIARASADVLLEPGDVIGSGTVGTGCLLELTKGEGPYLKPGDVVELEIERFGVLRSTIGERRR